jgi:hypothetical protein
MTTIPKIEVLDLAGLCKPIDSVGEGNIVASTHSFEVQELTVNSNGLSLTGSNINIDFVRGVTDKNGLKQNGVTAISLIECVIQHLKAINVGELANRDTSIAITHLEDAQLRLINRAMDRQRREVLFTSKA